MFSRTQKINLSPIKQIELLASKIPDVVSLAQGIPSFDTPEVVKKAAIKALNKGRVAKYSLTMGIPELRETIEQKLAEDHMFYDFEKEIVATAGSIEAITATFITLIDDKKDEIILFSPSYTSYAEAVKVAGGKPVFVPLTENEGWKIDFKNLEKKITSKTAGLLVCNPNNPTGTIFPKEDLYKIAELAYKKKFFIITDEVYKDFIYDPPFYSSEPDVQSLQRRLPSLTSRQLQSDKESDTKLELTAGHSSKQKGGSPGLQLFSLAQIPELRKNVIRIFSLSKAYAMTGWRIGFLHSDEEIVKEILKVHDSMVTCAPVISQYAAMAALDFGSEDVEKFRKEFEARRDIICGHLDELSEFFSYQRPNSSYFVFPKISRIYADYKKTNLAKEPGAGRIDARIDGVRNSSVSWDFALDLLEKAHVAVVPGVAFGPSGEGHVRMSFGRSEKDIEEAFKRIKNYLKS